MEIHITDSRHQTILSEMRAAFQKRLVYELSPDAYAMAATWGKHGKHGKGKGKDGNVQKGGR